MSINAAGHLVSVILPVRDGARYLSEALDSVRAQTYRPYELIVVEGGSKDGSQAIIESYQPDHLIHQQRPDLWAAFNLGLRASVGEYFAFISSDDVWAPDKLARQATYLDQHAGAQAVIGQVVFQLAEGLPAPRGFRRRLIGQPRLHRILEVVLARRSLFTTVGLLDESLAHGADLDWFARAHDLGATIVDLPGVMLYKRLHDRNLSMSAPLQQQRALFTILRHSLARRRQ